MGLFNKKKNEEEVFAKPVSFVTDKEGNKYLHIQQFAEYLKEYKNTLNDPNQRGLIDQLVLTLNEA